MVQARLSLLLKLFTFELLLYLILMFSGLLIAFFIDCLPRALDLFWNSVNLCSSRVEKEPVSTKSQRVCCCEQMGECWVFDTS